MSEWITDRLPTEADSDIMGKVWVWEDNAVYWSDYSVVTPGTPWMPIKEPAPYVDDEKHFVTYQLANCFKTEAQAEEAARRVRETLKNYHKELQNDQMES